MVGVGFAEGDMFPVQAGKEGEVSVEKYACYQCKALFELAVSPSGEGQEGAKCPNCGSTQIEKLPSWIPEGFNLELYFSPPEWEYKCHQCTIVFKLPVPSGPTEEKQRKCPACGSMDIERLTALVVEPSPYCG